MILIWVLLGCLMMCFIEYIIHRWIMHNKFTPIGKEFMIKHLKLHHSRYFKSFDFELDPAAKFISIDIDVLLSVIGLSPIWFSVFWWISPTGGLILASIIAFHGLIWNFLHRKMHFPSKSWIQNTEIFALLRHYHYLHHRYPGYNYNAVFPPLADWIFGTLIWVHEGK